MKMFAQRIIQIIFMFINQSSKYSVIIIFYGPHLYHSLELYGILIKPNLAFIFRIEVLVCENYKLFLSSQYLSKKGRELELILLTLRFPVDEFCVMLSPNGGYLYRI
jgi:hypothetical protein